jgi:predicted transcriptional regulator
MGYTFGMKTAISIPDDVFADAERLARATKKSRSQLYSQAVREYVARHAADQVTEALDAVCEAEDHGTPLEHDFTAAAARRTLRRSQW